MTQWKDPNPLNVTYAGFSSKNRSIWYLDCKTQSSTQSKLVRDAINVNLSAIPNKHPLEIFNKEFSPTKAQTSFERMQSRFHSD